MHKYGRLAIGLIVVAALVPIMNKWFSEPFQNKFLAVLLTVSIVFAIFVMLYGTPYWTWRTVGVLFFVTGSGVFFGWIAGSLLGWLGAFDGWEGVIARSFLFVGIVLLDLGLIGWLHHEKPGKRSDPLNGEDEVL